MLISFFSLAQQILKRTRSALLALLFQQPSKQYWYCPVISTSRPTHKDVSTFNLPVQHRPHLFSNHPIQRRFHCGSLDHIAFFLTNVARILSLLPDALPPHRHGVEHGRSNNQLLRLN